MMWILGGAYCLVIWLVFAKWRLMRLSLPLAVLLASVGPALILALLFCAQYYHPYTNTAIVFQKTVPITPQVGTRVRVTRVVAEPNTPLKQGDVLFEVDTAPLQAAADAARAGVDEAAAGVQVAEASVVTSKAAVARAEADLAFITRKRNRDAELVRTQAVTEEEYEQTQTEYQQAVSALDQAQAAFDQATLGVTLAKTRLAKARTSDKDAQYDLSQTTVTAPSEGYVTNLQLRPGALVGGLGTVPVMTFVETPSDAEQVVVATFAQKNFLLIAPGQYAEVILDLYPGRVFSGRVLNTIEITGAGQLTATGDLPEQIATVAPSRFAVRIGLDDSDHMRLPGGANGQAAVYTEKVQLAGLPVMFLIRAQGWLNFLW